MDWLKVALAFLMMVILFSSFALYWFMPFNSVEFTSSPVNSNFSMNSSALPNMQFFPNLRYPSYNISYNIDSTLCSLKKQDDIKTAFNTIQNLTLLNFYSANSNPEISVTCDNQVVVNENYFVAGEGGPTNITQTSDFNVITQGKVLLLRDSNCPTPNVAIHELLHALGFTHSTNPNNIMYPVTSCDQTIGQDIPQLIDNLYSVPSHPDLSFENASALIHGRYLDTNISVVNNGLIDSDPATLSLYADGTNMYIGTIPSLPVGEIITFTLTNIWVPSMSVNELEYQISSNFTELTANNKQIKLEIKK